MIGCMKNTIKNPNDPPDPAVEVLIIDNDVSHAETVAESLTEWVSTAGWQAREWKGRE